MRNTILFFFLVYKTDGMTETSLSYAGRIGSINMYIIKILWLNEK